ncbi:MAG: sporulation transcriptional regulator SpoIIID [Christensenellales bacterium]|jgi:putative DeoR family transcriptional regulator (stage III sporulation protein D)
MKDYIVNRVFSIANCIIDNGLTVREAAKRFNVSKSTVHSDVTNRLEKLDNELFEEVRQVLDFNFAMRHLRGGESTRKKYNRE